MHHAGTPEWNTEAGGNHDWVEVWDGGIWSFTGPTEYTSKAGFNIQAWYLQYCILPSMTAWKQMRPVASGPCVDSGTCCRWFVKHAANKHDKSKA